MIQVAVCRAYLSSEGCTHADCRLTHSINPDVMPVCRYGRVAVGDSIVHCALYVAVFFFFVAVDIFWRVAVSLLAALIVMCTRMKPPSPVVSFRAAIARVAASALARVRANERESVCACVLMVVHGLRVQVYV